LHRISLEFNYKDWLLIFSTLPGYERPAKLKILTVNPYINLYIYIGKRRKTMISVLKIGP